MLAKTKTLLIKNAVPLIQTKGNYNYSLMIRILVLKNTRIIHNSRNFNGLVAKVFIPYIIFQVNSFHHIFKIMLIMDTFLKERNHIRDIQEENSIYHIRFPQMEKGLLHKITMKVQM